MSALSAFTAHLVAFFDELCATFPEEKELYMATEAIKGAKKINPDSCLICLLCMSTMIVPPRS